MKRYLKLTTQLIDEFDDVKFEQIPRENNSATDEVANLASTEDALATTELFIEVQTIPSINGLKNLIRDGQLPSDPLEAKKVNVKEG